MYEERCSVTTDLENVSRTLPSRVKLAESGVNFCGVFAFRLIHICIVFFVSHESIN